MIARYIDPGSRVLDLGAGSSALRGVLPEKCEYQPCDIVGGPEVLRCDLNRGLWPQVTKIYDVAVVSGVLEYIRNESR